VNAFQKGDYATRDANAIVAATKLIVNTKYTKPNKWQIFGIQIHSKEFQHLYPSSDALVKNLNAAKIIVNVIGQV